MENKERRHQEEERIQLTEEQKLRIQAKSDDKCVWCGKKVFLGYKGTVDHFIPIKKGGTNDEVNLVLMCNDCNESKGSKIVPINVGARYLKKEHSDALGQYFEDYIHKYDYISRGNIMAVDMYELTFLPPSLEDAQNIRFKNRSKRKKDLNPPSRFILKRAYPDDEDKLTEYFAKYLTKYKALASVEAARENIRFWMRFGAIYFIEKIDGISAIGCVTVNKHGYISFDIFTYYSTALAQTMAGGIVKCLSEAIMEENNLAYIPVSVNMLENDELASYLDGTEIAIRKSGRINCKLYFLRNYGYLRGKTEEEHHELFERGIENYKGFISRFKSIEDDIRLYLYENKLTNYNWMADEILERDFFDRKYYQKPN